MNMFFTEEELVGSVAVWDMKLDMWVTGVWPIRFATRILDMWERNGRDISRYELRPRSLDKPDNTAVLIIDKDDFVIAYFHWENRHYASAFTDKTYRFVKYTPKENQNITDIYDRSSITPWNGKGKIVVRGSL